MDNSDGKLEKVDKVFFIQSLTKTIPELNKETKREIVDDEDKYTLKYMNKFGINYVR